MPDLAEEQEIFAATETSEDNQPAAAPVEAPAAPAEPSPAPVVGEVAPQIDTHQDQQERHVPYAALKEEREARKALQARVEELTSIMLRGQQQQPAKPTGNEPVVTPDLFEDPNAFIQHQPSPVQAELQQTREFYSQREAIREHGQETVQAAYSALGQAMQQGDQNAIGFYQKVMRSMDPYGELVTWHKRNQIISEVGTDPKAYEARLRAKILEELQGQAPAGQQPAGAPQPSKANTQPLPSLNRSYGNAGTAQGGAITEEDIFNAAPAFGKRKA